MTKKMFKTRLLAIYVMIVAWTISSPVLKTFYSLLPTWFFSIVGIWVLVAGLLQRPLRNKLSIPVLMKLVITLDIIYMIATIYFVLTHSVKGMLVFDEIIMGPYMASLLALDGKLESYYLGRFKPLFQDLIRSKITNNKQYSKIVGFILAAIASMWLNVYEILTLQVLIMFIGVILEIKSLR